MTLNPAILDPWFVGFIWQMTKLPNFQSNLCQTVKLNMFLSLSWSPFEYSCEVFNGNFPKEDQFLRRQSISHSNDDLDSNDFLSQMFTLFRTTSGQIRFETIVFPTIKKQKQLFFWCSVKMQKSLSSDRLKNIFKHAINRSRKKMKLKSWRDI